MLQKKKITICVSIISIACFVLIGVLFYKRGTQLVITQAKSEAMGIAQSAARDLDGDAFIAIKEKESQGYKDVYDALSEYKTNDSLGYIYSMKKVDDELVFVVDTDEEDPADFLEPYEWLPTMAPAFNGEVCADDEFTADEWGTYISGYAPIFDSKNQVAGIVGCDIHKNTIEERLIILRNIIIIVVVGFNIVMVAMFGIFGAKAKKNSM